MNTVLAYFLCLTFFSGVVFHFIRGAIKRELYGFPVYSILRGGNPFSLTLYTDNNAVQVGVKSAITFSMPIILIFVWNKEQVTFFPFIGILSLACGFLLSFAFTKYMKWYYEQMKPR